MSTKTLKKFIKIIKIELVIKPYNKYYGEEVINIFPYIRKKVRSGLINEACNDYLR